MPVKAAPIIRTAPRVKAPRRASIKSSTAILQKQRHQRREQAAQIGGQERQPGIERDLAQIEMPRGHQIKRHPEGQRAPGGIGQETGQSDAPEIPVFQQFSDGRFGTIILQGPLLAALDIGALFAR